MISKQSIFVSDRTTNMQFSNMQKKNCTGHLLRYNTTPNVPTLFTQSLHAKILAFIFFAATFTWSLLMFKFRPQTSVHTHLSVIAPKNVTTSSTKMHQYGIPRPIWPLIGSKTQTTTTKLGVIILTESQ